TLRAAGERSGLATRGFTDQSSFLTRLGVTDGIGAALSEHSDGLEEYFARRNVVLELIDPGKLGRIKVLLQGTGVPDGALRGFIDG
ncbi:MAG TPA: SAM-dependent methyltransferase, partial [Dehalococcoidia bacterium]